MAALRHTGAVTMPLLGQPMVRSLIAPLGSSHRTLALLLLLRGFHAPAAGPSAAGDAERLAMA